MGCPARMKTETTPLPESGVFVSSGLSDGRWSQTPSPEGLYPVDIGGQDTRRSL